jgi:hypothetical protein
VIQYPCFKQSPNTGCSATPHYPARECTSYCSWRASMIGHALPDWGNGDQWAGYARAAGFTVNGTPAINSIMALGNYVNGAGPKGHVAWVIGVETQTVAVAEYNFLVTYGYDERDARIAGAQFIHLSAPPSPPPPAPPILQGETDMMLISAPNGVYLLGNGAMISVVNAANEAALVKKWGEPVPIDQAMYELLIAKFPS